jgi:L-arabinose isomerase
MMMGFDGLRIWFLTGSQDLYGEAILTQVGVQSAAIVAGLNAASDIPVEIVHRPTVTTPEGIRRACLEATADDACIGVIGWMHTFSPAKMWIAGLQALGKPFLHLHTQYGRDLPYADIDMTFMNLNQSAHGDREFAYIVSRLRMPRKTIAGHWREPSVQARIGTWMRATVGVHEARTLKVVRFGDNMREVADTDGDKVEVQARMGISCNTHPVNELVDVVGEVADAEVERLCAEYDERYDVVLALRPGGDRRESLRDAARIELGLRAFLTDGGFGAFVDTFQDLGGLKQLPGIGAQRLMADGYGFGAEGDWKSSALVRIVKAMSQGLDGGVSFMEDYTYDFGAASPAVLGAHMLEVCPTIAAGTPSCEIHPLFVGDREDPVRLVFTGAPGPAVVVGMVDMGTHLRLVANEVDAVEPTADLPKLPVARALWVPRPDFTTSAESWLLAGGPHHTAYSQAIGLDVIEDFAEMLDVELLSIDAQTDARQFARELRWTQAYRHVAGGV